MLRSGKFGSKFDSVPIYEFIENLGNENEFAKSKTITATIKALRAADRADMLQGHGYIGSIQSLLVKLLNYVEGKEGFSLFVHDELDVRGTVVKCNLPDNHEPCRILIEAEQVRQPLALFRARRRERQKSRQNGRLTPKRKATTNNP